MMIGMVVQMVVVMGAIEAHILVSQLLIADTFYTCSMSSCQTGARRFWKAPAKFGNFQLGTEEFNGAGDEARTRNFQLGKLTLYH